MNHFSLIPTALGLTLLATPLLSAQDAVTEKPTTQPTDAAAKPAMATLDHSAPDALMRSIIKHVGQGNTSALWSAVAPEDRSVIQASIKTVASKIDAGVYDEVISVFGQLRDVMHKNASYIAHNPMLGKSGTPDQVKAQVKGTVEMIDSMMKSPLASHAKLAEADVGGLVAGLGSDVLKQVRALAKSPMTASMIKLPDFAKLEVGEAKIDGDVATVTVTNEGMPEELELRRAGGNWYFDITEGLEEMTEGIDEMPKMKPEDVMQAKGMMAMMVKPMLMPFQDCESQEDFDDAVEQTFGRLKGMLGGMMGGGGFGR